MKKLINAAFLATGLLVSSGAWADEDKLPSTVQDYIRACERTSTWMLFCYGHVHGVAKTMMINGLVLTQEGGPDVPSLCTSKGFSPTQAVKVFLNWANANPTEWQVEAQAGMLVALSEAWPCPK